MARKRVIIEFVQSSVLSRETPCKTWSAAKLKLWSRAYFYGSEVFMVPVAEHDIICTSSLALPDPLRIGAYRLEIINAAYNL